MNSNQCGIYIQQLQQSFNERFEDFDRYKYCSAYLLILSSHESAESKLQLELINIQCNEELNYKFKEGDLMNFTDLFLQKTFYIYDKMQHFVEVYSEVRTFVSKLFE